MYHLKLGTLITRLGLFNSPIPSHFPSSLSTPLITIPTCISMASNYPASNEVPSNKDSYPCISWWHILRTLLLIPSWTNASPHYLPDTYELVLFLNQGLTSKKGSPPFTITSLSFVSKCTLAQKKTYWRLNVYFSCPQFLKTHKHYRSLISPTNLVPTEEQKW